MKPQAGDGFAPRLGNRRPGFSLAELMIALAILAMGLLVIGAALPIGVQYTRDSVDLSTGSAAAEYALDAIAQRVCLRDEILDHAAGDVLSRAPVLFLPRYPAGTFAPDGITPIGGRPAADPNNPTRLYEPRIKVRPLYTQNINLTPNDPNYPPLFDEPNQVALTEDAIRQYLGGSVNIPQEYDPPPTGPDGGPWLRSAIPAVSVVYPPISADVQRTQSGFFTDMYSQSQLPGVSASERKKAKERRIVWTAFSRRVSYELGSDPTLHEFIVVACRLPSANHRFPVQDPTQAGMTTATASRVCKQYAGIDSLAPVPWLVAFQQLPELTAGTHYLDDVGGANTRALNDDFQPPATLTFVAGAEVGQLLPEGSIFIPAINDLSPCDGFGYRVGFVPNAPDALPIYKVIERIYDDKGTPAPDDDQYSIIVENNGFYPWLNTSTGVPASEWVVWVIPPAIEEMAGADPVFGDKSPILSVARRYVRLRLMP